MLLKRLSKIYLLIFLLLTKSDNLTKDVRYINISNNSDIIPQYSNVINLIIPKIDLDVYTTYETTLKEGLEIHELSTRPSDKDSTIIIMGHAGFGQNVYFNKLIKLEKDDKILIDYSNILFTYVIEKKDIIIKGSNYSFEFNNNYLYLITCYHFNKQIIIKAKMANF